MATDPKFSLIKSVKQSRQHQGFTLIELLLVAGIGALLLAGIAQLYAAQAQSYLWQQQTARLQEDARLAAQLMRQDFLPAYSLRVEAGVLELRQFGSPRQRISQLIERRNQAADEQTPLGEWSQQGQGNASNHNIRDVADNFSYLRQNDCLYMNGELFQRTSGGNNEGQGVIPFRPEHNNHPCLNTESERNHYRTDDDGNIYQAPQSLPQAQPRLVEYFQNADDLVRRSNGIEQTWLDNLVALQWAFLDENGDTYQQVADVPQWQQVQSIRVGFLLRSPQPLPRNIQLGDFQLLEGQPVVACPAGHLCLPYITTVRLRNHAN